MHRLATVHACDNEFCAGAPCPYTTPGGKFVIRCRSTGKYANRCLSICVLNLNFVDQTVSEIAGGPKNGGGHSLVRGHPGGVESCTIEFLG